MKNIDELNKIDTKVKNFDTEISKVLVPILQDTIADGNKHSKRLFILSLLAMGIVLIVTMFSVYLVYRQNTKYQEFLSQFEFQTEETIYQDLDSGEGDIVNSTINRGK